MEHSDGEIYPVTYELIGKAKELANKINHPVYCVFVANNIKDKCAPLLSYGVDEVFVYDDEDGLTADCIILDIQENTDLDQIRPAFSGNYYGPYKHYKSQTSICHSKI